MANSEIILAQEQGALNKTGLGKEIQGTLVLTNSRILFVAATTEISDAPGLGTVRYYADVSDLDSVSQESPNIVIPIEGITSAKGSKGIMTNPNLKIHFGSSGAEKTEEFVQTIIGGRKRNLNDWAGVIDNLKSGKINVKMPSWVPDRDSLEGRIVNALADLQEKGVFEIENEIESKYKIDLDPDKLEGVCDSLVARGVLQKTSDEFYRLPSPLGADDLSV